MSFFPKADAAVLLSRHGPPPTYPRTVWPIFDPDNLDTPVRPWPADVEKFFYPPPQEDFAPALVPDKPSCRSDRYLRAFLAENERLRSCMLWYYTRDFLKESEFLSGLQEKVKLAQESTGWEFAVIGILDVNYYIRLASIGLPLAILPRGETICAHTVTQPPGSVFLLPNMMEDWRFQESPYVESGGLRAYAGAPLRLQNESGDCVGLGSLCVASSTIQEPLTKVQQQTLARLADWVVSDIVQCARARRQRDRRQMSELISAAQREAEFAVSEDPVLRILRTIYQNAAISLQSSKADNVEIEGRGPVPLTDFTDGLWEDTEYLDDFIANLNHQEFPSTRVVRVIAASCETISGPSMVVVASKDFRLVFDDVDSWFIQTCASILSQMWHKRLLGEVMRAKEKFLRGVSHQLRTPIHGILGSVELLAEELMSRSLPEVSLTAKPGESTVYLDTIRSAGRDLISIVNSMITLNRWADIAMTDRHYAVHTTYELETVLASEIAKATSGYVRYRASVIFHHDLPLDHDLFRMDLNLLRDSLLPLIVNAIQNTSAGVVAVTISMRPVSKELIIDVEDTGRGIQPDDQTRIFEPYEKVGIHSAGAGLGLTLASKFATLLHGSVVLVKSDICRGSHFRARFQEVECSRSNPPPRSLAQKLKTMPSKFYNMVSGSDRVSVCDYFTRFLACQGFTASDSMDDDCFAILEYVPDLDERRMHLSRVPEGHVAICLVPASEGEACLEEPARNLVYVYEPFLTSKMNLALEEADQRLSEIETSCKRQLRLIEPSLASLTVDTDPTTVERVKSASALLDVRPALPPAEQVAELDMALPPTHDSHPEHPAEPRPIISNLPIVALSKPAALLVDDNAVNLRIMQMYCTKRGLAFYSATDGLQAVEIFLQQQSLAAAGNGAGIQLVLMDLQMPLCDGFEATRQIRQLEKQNEWTRSILFIVTGQDSPTDRSTAEDVGADDYFVKPVGIKVLDRGVKAHFPAFEAGAPSGAIPGSIQYQKAVVSQRAAGACVLRQALLLRAISPQICSSYPRIPRRRGSGFLPSFFSTKSAPAVDYGYVDGVEHLSDYRSGGYHPIHIDDCLNKRYRIVHKLGHGTFSTAWLAVDENSLKYVAIKVGTADADRTEAEILSHLTQSAASHGDSENILSLIPVVLDRFDLGGPNGTHPCLVTLPARCSLQDAKEASGSGLLQLDAARSLAAQLVLAVSLVHSQGYAHGDLHLGNLLLQLPSSLNNLYVEQLYAQYGEPRQEPVVCLATQAASKDPGVPSYAVPSVWLGVRSNELTLSEAKLILSDFGVAFRPDDKTRFESYTPLVLRPPEAFFEPTTPLTLNSDIWSLGCVIFELLAHRSLIDGFLAPQDEITAQQVELQGCMPPEWWGKWEKRPKWYDEAGKALSPVPDIWSWERRFEQWVQSPRRKKGMGTLGEDERDALFKLLRWMLAWRPSERPGIKEVLNADWITRWALPAYRKGLEGQGPSPNLDGGEREGGFVN